MDDNEPTLPGRIETRATPAAPPPEATPTEPPSGVGLAGWLRPGEPAEANPAADDHAALLRRMARELDRFHRDPAALRRIRTQGEERRAKPRVGPNAPIEARIDELNQRLAALERMLPGGEPTVAAEALSPLRTLLEVLSGEVARLRRAVPAAEASAVAVPPPLAAPEPAPMPPPRPVPARTEAVTASARRSALIPILALAVPVALLAVVFLDRVPEPARHGPPPHPLAAPAPHPLAAPAPTRIVAPAVAHPEARPSAAKPPAPAKLPATPAVAHPEPHPVAARPAAPATPTPEVGHQPSGDQAQAASHAVPASKPAPAKAAPPVAVPPPQVAAPHIVDGPGSSATPPPAPKPPAAPPPAPAASTPVKPPMPVVIAPSPTPADHGPTAIVHPAPPAAPPPPPIVLRVTQDAWISVIDAHGTPVFSRLMHAGESWIPPRPGLLLTTGNAGGTVLVMNGVAGPPLGAKGGVMHGVPLMAKPARAP